MKHMRELEKQFTPFITSVIKKNISKLPKYLFKSTLSTNEEDWNESFDMNFKLELQVSIRLREYEYVYLDDVTVRSRSKYGKYTEINKLIDGHGQLYFYGFLNPEETEIIKWCLWDIDAVRHILSNHGEIHYNTDGSEFKSYQISLFERYDAIIDKHIFDMDPVELHKSIKQYKIMKQVKKNRGGK